MKKILFVSPYSGRSGAEIYLYRFLKNYDDRQFQAMVVTEKYAPLFASLQPKIRYACLEQRPLLFGLKKGIRNISNRIKQQEKSSSFALFVEHAHRQFQPDEWVLNTIIMHKVMQSALRMQAKVTILVHEMPSSYSFVSLQGMQALMTRCHRIIGNSSLTCRAISAMGRSDAQLQPGFFDAEEIELRLCRNELRASLGIRPDEFVLVSSGSLDHNKGIELFMQISALAIDKPWKFLWIGGERKSGFNYYLHKYIESLKENNNLIFLGERSDDYYEYLNVGDAFLLTSFNESFSLSTLEAMALGKPVMAYDCGGVSDFVNDKCGRILGTRDPKMWLETINWLQEHHQYFSEASIKAASAQYSAQRQVPTLTSLLVDSKEQ